MSIEKITSKILEEATRKVEMIRNEAETKRAGILKEATEISEKLLKDSQENGEKEKAKIVERLKSVSDIDSRKVVLSKKQDLINECFVEAIEELTHMKEGKYLDFLVDLGVKSGVKKGELIFNEKEKTSLGAEVVQRLNKEVEGGAFQVADDCLKIKGGYMLRTGKTYINNTVEALIDQGKTELTGEIAKILFDGE